MTFDSPLAFKIPGNFLLLKNKRADSHHFTRFPYMKQGESKWMIGCGLAISFNQTFWMVTVKIGWQFWMANNYHSGWGGNGIDSAQFVYHVECRFYVHVKFHEFDTNHKARRILARMHGVFVAAMCESQQLKFHRVSSILLTWAFNITATFFSKRNIM